MPPINIANARVTLTSDLAQLAAVQPTYSRLEPLPYDPDFAGSLAAPVADPLWLIGRQWQLRELQGEDAGTPISVHLSYESVPITRCLRGAPGPDAATAATDYNLDALPLEAIVEHEAGRATHPRLSAEAGLHALRLLRAAGLGALAPLFRAAYPLTIPPPAAPTVDPDGAQWSLLTRGGRALDGVALAAALEPLRATDGALTALPATPAVPAEAADACKRVLATWLGWARASLCEPSAAAPDLRPAWNPRRQEYAFAAQGDLPDTPVVLLADEYDGLHVDWYSFDVSDRANRIHPEAAATLGGPGPAASAPMSPRPTLPVPLSYPGMPAQRFWEMEDAAVSLPKLDAGVGDLGRLLLVEFGLIYGNDWYVVPLDVGVGSLTRIGLFTVRDTFGVETIVKPARTMPSAGGRWEMFAPRPAPGAPDVLANLLIIPPTVPLGIDGPALEEVTFFRDEMANMSWAVERRVQGQSGDGYVRRESEMPHALPVMDPLPDDVTLVYRLMTSVPEHWIPFVPVPASTAPLGIALEQRGLIRPERDLGPSAPVAATPPFETPLPEAAAAPVAAPAGVITPLGHILRTEAAAPMQLEEEEVPREGILVRRAFTSCRWHGGLRVTWLGRSKSVGKGEGSSGLRFDAADKSRP